MRIWLEKGKQKELIEKEREYLDLNWRDLADKLGIKFSKLNSFHYEESLIDDLTFSKLNLKKSYERFIVHKLVDNWGKVKGGKLSSGSTKKIKIPKKDVNLAEFFGIMLGDGHVQKIQGNNFGTYNLTLTGHATLDKDYLLNFVKPLGERLFGIKARIYFLKTSKALQIIFDSRNLVDFFEKENFKSGDKIRNQSTIPSWIKENPKFLAACLRGLHDTDGTFYKLNDQNSYQIGFTNHNVILLKDAHDALISLGIGVSNVIDSRKYVITKKSEIAKFYKVVGFHNSKHLNKFKNVNLAP